MSTKGFSQGEVRKFPFLMVGLFLLLMAFSFSLTLSKNHNDAEDAVSYIDQVTSFDRVWLFHPNHLLYNFLNSGVYSAWQSAGYSGNAELPMQMLNVIASLAALAIMALIGWRLGLSRSQLLLSLVLVVSCYGYWWYSVEVEAYMLPLPFALYAWWQTLRFMQEGGRRRLLIAALGLAFAMLVHLQWIALLIALSIALLIHWWRNRAELANGEMFVTLLLAAGLTVATIVLAYSLAILWSYPVSNSAELMQWLTGEVHIVYRPPWTMLNPLKTLVGVLRAVWGGHFLFGFSELQGVFARIFSDKLLVEEVFLGNAIPALIRWLCTATSLLAALMALVVVYAGFSGVSAEKQGNSAGRYGLVLTALLIIAVFFVLNSKVVPTNLELYIGILPIAVLLAVSYISRCRKRRLGELGLWGFALLMLATNLTGSIIPQTNRLHDYWYAANRLLIEEALPTDVIIAEGGYLSDSYLFLFSKAPVERGRLMTEARVNELLEEYQNGRVLVSSWVFAPTAEIRNQLPEYDLQGAKKLFARYRLKLLGENEYQKFYQVTRRLSDLGIRSEASGK